MVQSGRSDRRCRTRLEPMKPQPPLTRTFIVGRIGLAGLAPRAGRLYLGYFDGPSGSGARTKGSGREGRDDRPHPLGGRVAVRDGMAAPRRTRRGAGERLALVL